MTPAERAHAFEVARLAAGGRRINIIIRPEAAAALERLRASTGTTACAIIEAALKRLDQAT